MSSTVKWLLLVSYFVHLDCEIYQDRPKIKTLDGDLILEPAFDKNIYLRPHGPKSSIFVGEINMLNSKSPSNSDVHYQLQNHDDSDKALNGILQRLEVLENKAAAVPNDLLFNITLLWRKVNALNRRVLNLQMNTRPRDECQSQPCQHGGTCLNLVNSYHCLCPPNWEGRDCDVDVNECRNFAGTDLGCQNGATCINRPGSYECLCRSGWFGLHCTRKEKDCSGGDFEMCGYGTCVQVSSGTGIKCICHQGWTSNGTGVACLTDVNECESSDGSRCSTNPKVDCVNLPGSYRCGQCPPGYEGNGHWCSDINECTTINNGGCSPMVTCHNTIGSRICGPCPPGYQGDGITCLWRGSCNINNGGCHPSAQCIEAVAGQAVQCICPEGMEGDGVGINGCYVVTGSNYTQPCLNNPCGINGQCHPLRIGYTCICYKGYAGTHCEAPINICLNNPCQNGGTCRPDVLRGFRCECSSKYTGPTCQMHVKACGGIIYGTEGTIAYPTTNTTYNNGAQCAWVIRTVPNKVLNVTFSRFDLEEHVECNYDFLQIHDGGKSSSQLIGRFCGNNLPKGGNIVSSHNNLYLWLHTDSTVAKYGFALHWTSTDPVCGGVVNATVHGHISSPGSPGHYPPNRDCYWSLTTSLEKRISLHFFALDIESHMNCSFDYLVIYDGEHETDPLLSKYCNSTQPAPIQSAGPNLLIHFHSDAYGTGNGFQIIYAPIDGVPGCGGYFTTDKGEISSPSYNGNYLSNLLCEYKVRTGPETKIKLEFKSFNLEGGVRCRYDYLKIYDGPSSDSRLVGKFCGNTFPKTYTSSSNTLFFKFKTDRTVSGEGFRITYEALCQKTIVGDSGVIKSPGYPFNYPENKICEYIIRTSPGKAIQLTFQDFDVEDNRYFNCRYDNVEVRDGPNINSTLLGKYCGGSEHIPPVTTSTHNYMYIKFSSDMSITGTGFYANYTTINTKCGGIYRETTGLINYPSSDKTKYENDQTCSWLIIAPEGMHIKLSWNRFEIEVTQKCRYDYLELIEIDNNNENNSLGRFCGTKKPPAVTSATNRFMLKFESDGNIGSFGFSVSYVFLDERLHCDGTYYKTHGYINSPGYPNPYEPNRDCTWIITVPVGQQIVLNISDFNLERPIRGKCDLGDFLEIRNGDSKDSPLVGQYCGSFQSRQISSLANVLYLHFHSDFYLSGRGFKIEWDGTIRGCGGTLTSSSGYISSPNYPNSYNENTECFYRIVISAGSRIRISFSELDLERTNHCRDDYVEIFNGRDSSASSLGKYCTMLPKIQHIETSTNLAYIVFRSDFYGTSKGFLLTYNTICYTNLTGRYGVIESPDYPSNYPENLNCLWNITVPIGNKINVTFSHFDISKGRLYRPWSYRMRYDENCASDYLQIKQSTDINFSNKLCGNSLPSTIHTNSNSLEIKFVTDNYMSLTGFRLEWVSYGCGGHIQKLRGVISLDKTVTPSGPLECEWLIETPIGTSISILFTSLFMSNSKNCTLDVIEIYNGPSDKFPLISKFCHKDPPSLNTDSNFMFIRFRKTSSLKDINFSAVFLYKTSSCGGRIQSALSGYIQSKNYPRNYDNNIDCVWYISVAQNNRIEINVIALDLYLPLSNDNDCSDVIYIYDSIKIIDSNYTYRICPNSNISQIITKSNNAVLQFKTDDFGTAKGFKVNFSMLCGGIINAEHDGILKNTEFISHTNNSCIWTILAPTLDQKISLTLTHISIPKNHDVVTNRNCPASFLRIYGGNNINAPVVGEYCGDVNPPMIVSRGSALTVEFGSYTDKIMGMFIAHYSPLSNFCGGTLTAEKGVITSPNYPLPFPNGLDCEWIIKTSPGNTAYVSVTSLDLEYSERCNEDYLEIRDKNGAGQLLGLYCGGELSDTNRTIASNIYINFHSNSKTSGHGFSLYYEYLHDNLIEGDRGEIASPLHPMMYYGSGSFTWRITVSDSDTITIKILRLLIPTYSELSYNKLYIYDGYDQTAPLLEELQGELSETKTVQTTANVVLIILKLDETNLGSIFNLLWEETSVADDFETERINCGSNSTELVQAGRSTFLKSPNYPSNYKNDLNCQWVYRTEPGRHLTLSFVDLKLEETHSCFADSVSVYSANSLLNWRPILENVCLTSSATQKLNASSYMKVKFKTDSSITNKGFFARIASTCGGFITDLSGEITLSDFDRQMVYSSWLKCDWVVKVRPGRTINVKFISFNITNTDKMCKTYLLLRNGDSDEAPFLGSGKYCGADHENRDNISTSSNALFISYKAALSSRIFQNFVLRYEETNVECGFTSKLTSDHKWEIITSPNFPSVPTPYTECEWVFTGTPGEILRIDFIDTFDLQKSDECTAEVVEIRDGSSKYSPSLGRFCNERPSKTIKTTSNVVYINYLTQVSEPNVGFKLNVSIDICGGTIQASAGELTSPGYPHMHGLKSTSNCEWRIIVPLRHIIQLNIQDLNIPESENTCETNLSIQEHIHANNSIVILKNICSDVFEDEDINYMRTIESSTNEVIVKLSIGTINTWNQFSEYRGFKISFNSSRPTCGGRLTMSSGFLTNPSYPRESSVRYCQWTITVPNKKRRVRLELIDFDTEKQRIGLYNDDRFQTSIKIIPSAGYTPSMRVFESSGNKLAIYVWMSRSTISHRFKARFSSEDEALCGGDLTGHTGELISPNLQRSYTCEWHLDTEEQNTDNAVVQYNTIYVSGNINSSKIRNTDRCNYYDPKLKITSDTDNSLYKFDRNLCGNNEFTYRIPSRTLRFTVTKSESNSMYYHLNWKVQPCGGIINLSENPVDLLNLSVIQNDTIECAWIIHGSVNNKVEVNVEGSFQLECKDQYIKIMQGLNSLPLRDICKGKALESPLIAHFSLMYVEYHSKPVNNTSLKLTAKIATSQCGGELRQNQYQFSSPNYPKSYAHNQECAWEIQADVGYRVSLQFVERFVIEDTPNCTKDVVIIYDWHDDMYTEIARVCGRQVPPLLNSTNNRMKVVLRTDADINLPGFKAQWTPICGGKYVATDKEHILFSPGYPYGYPYSTSCEYEISASDNTLLLKFLDFALEGSYPECRSDNLTLIAQNEYDYLHSTYCGSESPPILTNYEKVSLIFKSDRYFQRRGFKISYSIYKCGGKVNDTKILTSNLGENYNDNLNCTWLIEAPSSKVVILKFLYIDLEGSDDCYSDYISVYEGPIINYEKRLALLCGFVNSTTFIRTKNNKSVLEFITDVGVSRTGFKVEIIFSYGESVGCGGHIDLANYTSLHLKSPLIGNNVIYENFLDCEWLIVSPPDTVIKINFTSFHISPCKDINQTALGSTMCDCDFVEIKDGINPNSLSMGTYCGHSFPPPQTSSYNTMSVILSTDGEYASSGFEATIYTESSVCGTSRITISLTPQRFVYPVDANGNILRGLHCIIHIRSNDYFSNVIRITVIKFDLLPPLADGGNTNICTRDKLIITDNRAWHNATLGKNYVTRYQHDYFYEEFYYDASVRVPTRIELCGLKEATDYYFQGSIDIHLVTAPESDGKNHIGVELEAVLVGNCGRNYTETQGRIQSTYETDNKHNEDCYTLISAPENYTISVYFMNIIPDYWDNECYLDIYDGNTTSATRLKRITREYDENHSIFSSGRYLLLYNHPSRENGVNYDLNYVTTNKGQGCGGKLNNVFGRVTSPFYPKIYRQQKTCEWELETPKGTRLKLHFSEFELGVICDQNYLELVNSKGSVISRYCDEDPADYTSEDNYIKIVFVTTRNNGGKGWVAEFGTKV